MKVFYLFLLVIFISCTAREIRDFKGVTTGKIIGQGSKYYRGDAYNLRYTYTIDKKKYLSEHPSYIRSNNLNTFLNKYFIVLYSTKDPSKSQLLLTPSDYSSWGMQFPDSLNWVKDKIGF
jgi:hypothetical protein